MGFSDRADAGQRLAELLRQQGLEHENVVVLGLPRGGVPVAFEVAQALGAPLDVIVVRKLGVPFQPELAMGAIGEGGVRILNDDVLRMAMVDGTELALVERRERTELERRARRFRGSRPPVALRGRTVVVVDDGMATGASARAACQVARAHGAGRVVMAVPVASRSAVDELAKACDGVTTLEAPENFHAVGAWYGDFRPTSDDEVVMLLERSASGAAGAPAPAGTAGHPPILDEEVELRLGTLRLAGHFTVPEALKGMVVFAHGSGSSRHSPRNRFVASVLNEAGLGTLLFDLLGADEERDRSRVFDIPRLADRLERVTGWLAAQPESAGVAYRLLRCQHGSGGGPVGGGIHAAHCRRRLAGRAPRSRPVGARGRAGTHTAHCGWARRCGARPQPSRPGSTGQRDPARRGAGRHSSLRRTWSARGGGPPGTRLVRPPLGSPPPSTILIDPSPRTARFVGRAEHLDRGRGRRGTCGPTRTVRPDPAWYQSLICRILMYRSEMAGVRCAVTERGMR
jgi:putative phosphoribosyl transferase